MSTIVVGRKVDSLVINNIDISQGKFPEEVMATDTIKFVERNLSCGLDRIARTSVARTIYDEIHTYELSLYSACFPKSSSFKHGQFATYGGGIPQEALTELNTALKSLLFDDIEIWETFGYKRYNNLTEKVIIGFCGQRFVYKDGQSENCWNTKPSAFLICKFGDQKISNKEELSRHAFLRSIYTPIGKGYTRQVTDEELEKNTRIRDFCLTVIFKKNHDLASDKPIKRVIVENNLSKTPSDLMVCHKKSAYTKFWWFQEEESPYYSLVQYEVAVCLRCGKFNPNAAARSLVEEYNRL
jgi:hypothetical protein